VTNAADRVDRSDLADRLLPLIGDLPVEQAADILDRSSHLSSFR
jgi:hypothetical protein